MSLILSGYATPPKRVTLAQLEARWDWKMLHPELRRRLLAAFEASEYRLGFGSGGRGTLAQRALFLDRYVVSTNGTGILWEGQRWVKKPGVASAAPPGRSYHEETTPEGWALAADLIGDLAWLDRNGARFKLKDFSDVNDEPWHVQPVEVPNSRSAYRPGVHVLVPMHFATVPVVAPVISLPTELDEEDPMFKMYIQVPNDPNRGPAFVLFGPSGTWMIGGLTKDENVKMAKRLELDPTPEDVSVNFYNEFQTRALKHMGYAPKAA